MTESFQDIRITQVPAWRQQPPGAMPPGPRLELYALRETPEIAAALKVMAERRITVAIVPSPFMGHDEDGKPLHVTVELRNTKLLRFRWAEDVPNVDAEIGRSITTLLEDVGTIYRELVN